MRLVLAMCLLLGVLPARAGPAGPEPPWDEAKTEALRALAREYAGKTDPQGKDEVLDRARALGPIPDKPQKDVVKALFAVAREGPKSEGKSTCTAKFPRFPGTYQLSGTGGGRKGVFIGLHGGGPGVGEGGSAAGQWGGATGKGLIGVFPTANLEGRETTWQSPDVEAFVIAVLAELKRAFPIDTNRVYIAGHSLGGSGAYHIGLRHADLFAAVSPNAGGCHGVEVKPGEFEVPGGFVANLLNTGCFITHYDQDPRVGVGDSRAVARELDALSKEHPGGYDHVYVEPQRADRRLDRGQRRRHPGRRHHGPLRPARGGDVRSALPPHDPARRQGRVLRSPLPRSPGPSRIGDGEHRPRAGLRLSRRPAVAISPVSAGAGRDAGGGGRA
ncbi:MAG: alpha/beta hydrolase-fold protein [Planctomycetes bacterium]|nr:alpha/beta hydrolase-fold protein [Planctomycetota bacterium]